LSVSGRHEPVESQAGRFTPDIRSIAFRQRPIDLRIPGHRHGFKTGRGATRDAWNRGQFDIRELAKKTHRGFEGRALQGLHTGGRCFEYRGTPIEDPLRTDSYGRPQIVGVKLEIHPEQAGVVKGIFADYAAGNSITTTAKKLNAEGIKSPAPHRGQRHPLWVPSAISVMLHNDR
jgi:Recombinase